MEKKERKTIIREKTRQTSWILKVRPVYCLKMHRNCTYTNITNRITLSNLNSSQKVLMRRSTIKKEYCTKSMERYLVKESFIL